MLVSLASILLKARSYCSSTISLQDVYFLFEDTYKFTKEHCFAHEELQGEETLFLTRLERLQTIPLAYELGYTYFYGLRIFVNPSVLIPRTETEELVFYLSRNLKEKTSLRFWDVCTGSGCIALSLAKICEQKAITYKGRMSDVDEKALVVAKQNLAATSFQLEVVCCNALKYPIEDKVDWIIANPPYIKKGNFVAKTVLQNEPHHALFAEENGLFVYRLIFEQAKAVLKENGEMFFEISPDLVDGLMSLSKRHFPTYEIIFIKDMNQFTRFLHIRPLK